MVGGRGRRGGDGGDTAGQLFGGDADAGFKCELQGCIAFGVSVGQLQGQKAVLQSKTAISLFEKALDGESFMLEILENY